MNNPFSTVWFWFLLLSIIAFIVSFVYLEVQGASANGIIEPAAWIWAIFGLAIGLFVLSVILYWVDLGKHGEERTVAKPTSPSRLPASPKPVNSPVERNYPRVPPSPRRTNDLPPITPLQMAPSPRRMSPRRNETATLENVMNNPPLPPIAPLIVPYNVPY